MEASNTIWILHKGIFCKVIIISDYYIGRRVLALMLPMKQAIDKTVKQNLLGRGVGSSPLSFAVTRTQV